MHSRTWRSASSGLLPGDWDIALLERRDILADEPRFRDDGVSSLHTAVYRLQRL